MNREAQRLEFLQRRFTGRVVGLDEGGKEGRLSRISTPADGPPADREEVVGKSARRGPRRRRSRDLILES